MKTIMKKKLTKRQKKKLKKIAVSILIFYLLCTIGTFFLLVDVSEEKPKPSSYFYVNDYSGVLSNEAEEYIYHQAQQLDDSSLAQIVVVTVPDTGKKSLEKYSLDLANEWKIGQKNSNNGVLILFTTEEPHVRLEVGYGLTWCLSDEECGQILDENAVEDIHNGNWNQAAINTWKAVAYELYNYSFNETPLQLQSKTTISAYAEKDTMADATLPKISILSKIAKSLIIALFLTFFPLGLSKILNITKKSHHKNNYNKDNDNEDINQTIARNSVDDFISWWDDLGGDSGSGGGSSSGGGGGFGGGGASR